MIFKILNVFVTCMYSCNLDWLTSIASSSRSKSGLSCLSEIYFRAAESELNKKKNVINISEYKIHKNFRMSQYVNSVSVKVVTRT